jgi:hypothetical protein
VHGNSASNSADAVSAALLTVLDDHGWQVSGQPDRLRAMINDVLANGSHDSRSLVDAIVIAAQEGVPRRIDDRSTVTPTAGDAYLGELAGTLSPWGLSQASATWSVEVWRWAHAHTAVPVAEPPTPATATRPPQPTETDRVLPAAVVSDRDDPPTLAAVGPEVVAPATRRHRRVLLAGAIGVALLLVGGGAWAAVGSATGRSAHKAVRAVESLSVAAGLDTAVSPTPTPSATHAGSSAGPKPSASGPSNRAGLAGPGAGARITPSSNLTTPASVVTSFVPANGASVIKSSVPVVKPPAVVKPKPPVIVPPVSQNLQVTLQLAYCGASLCANPMNIIAAPNSGPWTAVHITSGPSWGSAYVSGTQIYYTAVSNTTGTDHLTFYLSNAQGTASNASTLTIYTHAA